MSRTKIELPKVRPAFQDVDAGARVDRVLEILQEQLRSYNPTGQAFSVTNPNTRRTFDPTTVTLQELAEVVGTILADLGAS